MVSQAFSIKALATMISLLTVSANAHMMMATPEPYGKSTLDNSPLAADGSDFPCKLRTGVYDLEGASNIMAIGEPQTLSFIGSAVHGGGSCQVSLTTDLQPSASSKWMVIQSIEGGCPSNVTGNLPDDASGTGAAVFQYTIPEGIPTGQYTIAWSWLNKIGNREFYMNCGPATITAAKKKRYAPALDTSPVKRQSTTFPQMLVANLAGVSNGCTTIEDVDILYPDPGSAVTKEPASFGPSFGPPNCTGSELPQIAPNGVQAAGAVPSSGASAAASGAASAAPVASSVGASSAAPGVFATGAAGASSAAPAPAASTAVVSPIPEASTPVASAAPAATSSSTTVPSTTGVQSGACSDEGEWYCSSDGSSFQRCASGQWSVPMAMAAGTTCTPGMSADLAMAAGKLKRHASIHARRLQKFGRVLK